MGSWHFSPTYRGGRGPFCRLTLFCFGGKPQGDTKSPKSLWQHAFVRRDSNVFPYLPSYSGRSRPTVNQSFMVWKIGIVKNMYIFKFTSKFWYVCTCILCTCILYTCRHIYIYRHTHTHLPTNMFKSLENHAGGGAAMPTMSPGRWRWCRGRTDAGRLHGAPGSFFLGLGKQRREHQKVKRWW